MTTEDIDSAMENPDNAEAYMLAVFRADIDEMMKHLDKTMEDHQLLIIQLRQQITELCTERAKLCMKLHGTHQWTPMGNHPYPDYQCDHCGAIKS